MPGRADEARSDASEALAAGRRSGSRSLSEWPVTVVGFVDVSLGNYPAALTTLQPELSPDQTRRRTALKSSAPLLCPMPLRP